MGIALCLLGGCSGPPTAEVSGTVTYDGKPVAKGNLGVLCNDGRIAQCPIENGFYSLLAPVGHVSAQRPQETHGVSLRLMSSGVVTSVSKPIRMKS